MIEVEREEPKEFVASDYRLIAEELERVAPAIGPAMDAGLFGGKGFLCFSFRQLDFYVSIECGRRGEAHDGLPQAVLTLMDDAIIRPMLRAEPPMTARGGHELLLLFAGWLLAIADAMGERVISEEENATMGLITKLAVRTVLVAAHCVDEPRLAAGIARLAGVPAHAARRAVAEGRAEWRRRTPSRRRARGGGGGN
jgi:hypothetical protein